MLSHTFTFTAHLASSLRWQFHEDSYIQHKNEQNWLLHKMQMYKFFSPESFIKKKKKFTVKILPHINSAIPSFPSSEKWTYLFKTISLPTAILHNINNRLTMAWPERSQTFNSFFFQAGSSALLHFPVFYLMTQSRSVLVLLVRFRRWNWELASVFHCPRIPASLDFKLSPFLAWG